MKKRASDSTGLGVLMVDVKQAAAMCNIGVSTVWKLVKNGKFPKPIAFTPKCVRWKRSDIVEWVKTVLHDCTHTHKAGSLRKPAH